MSVEKAVDKIKPSGTSLNDIYNARIFCEMHGETLRWCRDFGGWFIYDGKVWVKDTNDIIKKYAIETHAELFNRLKPLGDWTAPHIKRSGSDGGMNSMLNCAKPMLACDAEQFDKHKYLINCYNGTFNLLTGGFSGFNQDDMLTKIAHVEFDKSADCPRWMKFLDEIFLGNQELIDYMQRICGYSMTADTTEQCMFLFYGHGRNGKSKFLESIVNIMGDYAKNCPSTTFVQKQGNYIPSDLARLKGARIATAIESNQNVNLDEAVIKQVTGDDRITARYLNKDFFEFSPTFKVFIATNHKPNIRGTDTGIWRRLQMIPFELNITEAQDDKNLSVKLKAEYSGIFNWMIAGYKQWKEQGLNPPDKVKKATALYREEEDDIGQFIKDECVLVKGGFIPASEFRDKFKQVMGYPKGSKTLAEYMARRGFRNAEDNRVFYHGKQQRGYVNIRWATEVEKTGDNNNGWEE